MDTSTAPVAELDEFDLDTVVPVDGPALECPVCRGTIEQIVLSRDLAGFEPASCDDCGALLAA